MTKKELGKQIETLLNINKMKNLNPVDYKVGQKYTFDQVENVEEIQGFYSEVLHSREDLPNFLSNFTGSEVIRMNDDFNDEIIFISTKDENYLCVYSDFQTK